jgi:c-di-GMP-binding flagellar brake protein YcgR
MISEYIRPGDKLELQSYGEDWKTGDGHKIYVSKVYDLISEETMDIMMPIEKGQLQLLPIDGVFNVVFYTGKGLFECYCKVTDRYRSGTMYILTMDIMSQLQKLQRREYYRFTCNLNLKMRALSELELESLRDNPMYLPDDDENVYKAVIVDISGGGLRCITGEVMLQTNTRVYISYRLTVNGKVRDYKCVGRIVKVRELENRPGNYEHRIEYTNIDEDDREDIIHYIFEEERKLMRRG